VLIESTLPARAALPVLQQPYDPTAAGTNGVVATLPPVLAGLRLPNGKPSAVLGEVVTVLGQRLDLPGLTVQLSRPGSTDPPMVLQPVPPGTASEMSVQLLDPPAQPAPAWQAGVYVLSIAAAGWSSNGVPFALAPTLSGINPVSAPRGTISVSVDCAPPVDLARQRVLLLWGDRQIPPLAPGAGGSVSTLRFRVTGAQPGVVTLRLRVDGVDSVPVDFTSAPPRFAADQQVSVT
jgi:hypothetical protein